MIRWLYDILFTRDQWKVIESRDFFHRGWDQQLGESRRIVGKMYVLQNQRGAIKFKSYSGADL